MEKQWIILGALVAAIFLSVGTSQAYANMTSIETDQSQYFTGDQIKVIITVEESDTFEAPPIIRILTPAGNNIVAISQANHIIPESFTYEAIMREIEGERWNTSGNYILQVARNGESTRGMQISYVAEQSANPNRPVFSDAIIPVPEPEPTPEPVPEPIPEPDATPEPTPEPEPPIEPTPVPEPEPEPTPEPEPPTTQTIDELQLQIQEQTNRITELENEIITLQDRIIQLQEDIKTTIDLMFATILNG